MKPDPGRRAELAQIRMAGRVLFLNERAMRELVLRVSARFRKSPATSAGQLDHHERIALITELRRIRRMVARGRGEERIETMRPHLRMLFERWSELVRAGLVGSRLGRRALRRFVRDRTGVDAPEWLTAGQCDRVNKALRGWLERESEKQHVSV